MTTRRRLATIACAIAGLAVLAPSAPAASWLEPVELDTPATLRRRQQPRPRRRRQRARRHGRRLGARHDRRATAASVRVAYRPAGGALSVQTLARQRPRRRPRTRASASTPPATRYVAWEAARADSPRSSTRCAPPGGSAWDVEELAGDDGTAGRGRGGRGRVRRHGDLRLAAQAGILWQASTSRRRRRTAGSELSAEDVTTCRVATLDVRQPAVLATAGDGDATAVWVVRGVSGIP